MNVSAFKIATIQKSLLQNQIGVKQIALIFVIKQNMIQKELMPHLIGMKLVARTFAKRNRVTHIQANPTGKIPINAIALV